MNIHFELLQKGTLELLRIMRNHNREWFKNSKEISLEEQLVWWYERDKRVSELNFFIVDSNTKARVGFIALTEINHNDSIAQVGRMMILDEYKHKGYMLLGLIKMFDLARIYLGLNTLTLEVLTSNVPARELYTKTGFLTYGFTKDTLIMRKKLM